jgi:hypothetical protein
MFTKKNSEPTAHQIAMNEMYRAMAGVSEDSPEYTNMVDNLIKLNAIAESNSKKGVSADTVALILGNLAGILMIVGHERANVVTSKALSFVMKLK